MGALSQVAAPATALNRPAGRYPGPCLQDAEEAPAADASSSPPQIDKVQAQHYPAPPGPPATPPPQQDPASAATPSTGQRPFSPPPGRAPLGPGPEQQQQEPPGEALLRLCKRCSVLGSCKGLVT